MYNVTLSSKHLIHVFLSSKQNQYLFLAIIYFDLHLFVFLRQFIYFEYILFPKTSNLPTNKFITLFSVVLSLKVCFNNLELTERNRIYWSRMEQNGTYTSFYCLNILRRSRTNISFHCFFVKSNNGTWYHSTPLYFISFDPFPTIQTNP